MRISIKIKFSVFLAALLLLTVAILSILVLGGIRNDQQAQYEAFLAQQARTANLYFFQLNLTGSRMAPEVFLSSGANELAQELGRIIGQPVALYDKTGKKTGASSLQPETDIATALSYALENQIAYQIQGDSLYYLAPLTVSGEQVGVVQLYYSLERNNAFYDNIQTLFLSIGLTVFLISFLLGYFYFNSFANGILKLKAMAERIRAGQYELEVPKRKDELGQLGEGISDMSRQIVTTIGSMRAEQEKLTLALAKLSELEKQQKQFIGNVTHEFKTPLTSVRAYLDLIEMYPDDDALLETAKASIRQETERLYEMVEKVLQLSAVEKYDFEYTMEPIDAAAIILQVCDSLKGKMDKFGIRLERELAPAPIRADKENMVIILVNLLDNAIKYNKPQGAIHVKSHTAHDEACIEISDTGIGIPADAKEKIFEPFYTADKARSRQNGGSGVGLSLVKKLAEAQGGTVALIKTGPEGSTFRLCFPVYKELQ